jgi:hypothetical protein
MAVSVNWLLAVTDDMSVLKTIGDKCGYQLKILQEARVEEEEEDCDVYKR